MHLNFSCKSSCTDRYNLPLDIYLLLEARTDPANYLLLKLFSLDAVLYFNFSVDVFWESVMGGGGLHVLHWHFYFLWFGKWVNYLCFFWFAEIYQKFHVDLFQVKQINQYFWSQDVTLSLLCHLIYFYGPYSGKSSISWVRCELESRSLGLEWLSVTAWTKSS